MAEYDVPGLVGEDGLHLLGGQIRQEGVGDEDISERPGQAYHPGIGQDATGLPQADIAIAETEVAAGGLEPCP